MLAPPSPETPAGLPDANGGCGFPLWDSACGPALYGPVWATRRGTMAASRRKHNNNTNHNNTHNNNNCSRRCSAAAGAWPEVTARAPARPCRATRNLQEARLGALGARPAFNRRPRLFGTAGSEVIVDGVACPRSCVLLEGPFLEFGPPLCFWPRFLRSVVVVASKNINNTLFVLVYCGLCYCRSLPSHTLRHQHLYTHCRVISTSINKGLPSTRSRGRIALTTASHLLTYLQPHTIINFTRIC